MANLNQKPHAIIGSRARTGEEVMETQETNSNQDLMNDVMTLTDIAKYLKVSEKTVLRMLKRGDLPGAKISNQWRFQRTIIDKWLTERMQNAADEDLVDILRTKTTLTPVPKLVGPERIVMNVLSGEKDQILKQLVLPLKESNVILDAEQFLNDVIDREEMASTAIGGGVALPHRADHDTTNVIQPSLVLGLSVKGIDFDSTDGKPVHIFVLPCAPSTAEYLRLIAKVTLMLRRPNIMDDFLKCKTKDNVMDVLLNSHFDLSIRF